jgi:LPXTG-motif cell wall-anchored protein
LVTPESGSLNLIGLDAGQYYLVETKSPTGYNRLKTPITVVISHADGSGDTALTVNGELTNPQIVNVQNNAGTMLPETGGEGVTIFIVIGLALMTAAAILFLCRRKPNTATE